MSLRATAAEESEGLDITEHGEEAYAFGGSMSPAADVDAGSQPALAPARAEI
jgi:hypothetical protein